MVQDDVRREPDTEGAEPRDRRRRSLPGILLLVVILIVILLLWIYWLQRPEPSPLTAIKKTTETTDTGPEVRPDPTIPGMVTGTVPPTASQVPDVVGSRKSTAEGVLADAGYGVTSSDVYSASKVSGIVVAQSPSGGTTLDSGETVAIVVSVGTPTTENVTMPKIVGLTQAAAESAVEAAGLVPYLIYGNNHIEEGRVISQWPAAGESVPTGSEGFIQVQMTN